MHDGDIQHLERYGSARWRSSAALTPSGGSRASRAVLVETEPGCRLERHRDSADETERDVPPGRLERA